MSKREDSQEMIDQLRETAELLEAQRLAMAFFDEAEKIPKPLSELITVYGVAAKFIGVMLAGGYGLVEEKQTGAGKAFVEDAFSWATKIKTAMPGVTLTISVTQTKEEKS